MTYGQTNCHTTRFDNQSKLKVVVDNLLSREITLTNVKTGSLGSKLDRNHVKIPQQGNTMPGNTSNNLNKKERVSDLITKFEFKKPNPGNGTKQENKGTGAQEMEGSRKCLTTLTGNMTKSVSARKKEKLSQEMKIQPTGKITRKREGGAAAGNSSSNTLGNRKHVKSAISLFENSNGERKRSSSNKNKITLSISTPVRKLTINTFCGLNSPTLTDYTIRQRLDMGLQVNCLDQSGEGNQIRTKTDQPMGELDTFGSRVGKTLEATRSSV